MIRQGISPASSSVFPERNLPEKSAPWQIPISQQFALDLFAVKCRVPVNNLLCRIPGRCRVLDQLPRQGRPELGKGELQRVDRFKRKGKDSGGSWRCSCTTRGFWKIRMYLIDRNIPVQGPVTRDYAGLTVNRLIAETLRSLPEMPMKKSPVAWISPSALHRFVPQLPSSTMVEKDPSRVMDHDSVSPTPPRRWYSSVPGRPEGSWSR